MNYGLATKKKDTSEFKPDVNTSTWMKTNRMTQQQRLRLTKWVLYVVVMVTALILQDVIMSQISILGATTDLAVCVILMITVIEGTETGSLFVLLASLFYYFSIFKSNYSVTIFCNIFIMCY